MSYEPSPSSLIADVPKYLGHELRRIADEITRNAWRHNFKKVTADYIAGREPYIFADASSAAITISLPQPNEEMILNVKKTDDSANTVTLDADSVNIDGDTTAVIVYQYDSLTVYWDTDQWWIV